TRLTCSSIGYATRSTRHSSPSFFTRSAVWGMSSRWSNSLRRAFALRLGLWYAALFIVSAATLAVFTYVVLARALAAEDHSVLQSMPSRYAGEYEREGLGGLQELIDDDAGEGLHERLLVRVVNGQQDL